MTMRVKPKHDLTLAADFFFKFARFGYAMKAVGYLKRSDGKAEPDWRGLALNLQFIFENPPTDRCAEAVNYYLTYPPKQQRVQEGHLVWEEVEPSTEVLADKVLIYVRRVRNNLFHGGKFAGRFFEDPERSDELMTHGLVILDACVEALPQLEEAYNQ